MTYRPSAWGVIVTVILVLTLAAVASLWVSR